MAYLRLQLLNLARTYLSTLHQTSPHVMIRPSVAVQMYSTESLSQSPEVAGGIGDEEMVPERLYTKINIKVKGFDYAVLDSYMKFVCTAGNALGIKISNKVALPNEIKKLTVLKSPHIFKKHRVQYEMKTHSRLVQVKEITGTTADVFLEYIQRNLPEGTTMSVYQQELEELPKLLRPDLLTDLPDLEKKKTKK